MWRLSDKWAEAQNWERQWWGLCLNTYGEEMKQLLYADRMGLRTFHDGKSPFNIDLGGRSVVDLGGGPSSLLLKCHNRGRCVVVDPCSFPDWVYARYEAAGIEVVRGRAEDADASGFDEAWLYNVLQHTDDPTAIVATARRAGIVRVFEWIDTPSNIGHPHSLSEATLNSWLGEQGKVETLNGEATCIGKCYYGAFTQALPKRRKFRFHLLGLVHLPQSPEYMACAFTQKNLKMARMLRSLGHEVIFYGSEGSDVECDQFVQTHTLADIRADYGEGDDRFAIGYDWHFRDFKHDFNTARNPSTLKFNQAVIDHINATKRPDDFLLLGMGQYQKPIADAVKLYLTCEYGIGYRGSIPQGSFRAFESAYLQNYTYGSENRGADINGNYYDRVIPNYFDPDDIEFSEEKGDYYLFVGRLIKRKGIMTAYLATKAIGAKLIIAGQNGIIGADGSLGTFYGDFVMPHDSDWEYLGFVDVERRKPLMAHAIATFVPTEYMEAFAGVHVESMLSGTPVITTNFSVFPHTFEDGVGGYHCNTLDDFVWAAEAVKNLNPHEVRAHAEKYLMDNVRWEFERWFDDLHQLYLSTLGTGIKGWHHIRSASPSWRRE